MKTISFLFSVAVVCHFTSCKSYPKSPLDKPFKNVVAKISASDTLSYRFDSLIDFDWDRLIILKPYCDKKRLKQDCGIVSEMPDSKIDGTEGSDEYLFIKAGKIISYHFTKNEGPSVVVTSARSVNDMIPKCGIPNTAQTFIKLIPNANPDWTGRTFKVFLKD